MPAVVARVAPTVLMRIDALSRSQPSDQNSAKPNPSKESHQAHHQMSRLGQDEIRGVVDALMLVDDRRSVALRLIKSEVIEPQPDVIHILMRRKRMSRTEGVLVPEFGMT